MKKIRLMTHIVAGYPNLNFSEKLVELMADQGIDFVEIQIPFSDPMADGPIIMKANQAALDNGIRVKDSLALMKRLKKKVGIPLLFMGYYNTIFHYGVDKFCEDARGSGAYGLIVPDITLEEGQKYFAACKKNGLHNIFVIAPNTPIKRLKEIAKLASGFVYCTARSGVTGKKTLFEKEFDDYMKRVKSVIKLPIAVGFGIKQRSQLKFLEGKAEIAVIGTALLEEIMNSKSKKNALERVRNFLRKL